VLHLHNVSRSAHSRTRLHMHTCIEETALPLKVLVKILRTEELKNKSTQMWGLWNRFPLCSPYQFNLRNQSVEGMRKYATVKFIMPSTCKPFVWRVIELLVSERSEIIGQLTIWEKTYIHLKRKKNISWSLNKTDRSMMHNLCDLQFFRLPV